MLGFGLGWNLGGDQLAHADGCAGGAPGALLVDINPQDNPLPKWRVLTAEPG